MSVAYAPITDATFDIRMGDVLDVAPTLVPESFRLIYLDPPFFTRRDFEARGIEGGFGDKWDTGLDGYMEFLGERLRALKPLLAEDGSLLLHLDWRAVHYAKVACDRIFGFDNFQNELIWSYNSGGGSKRRYGRKHDTILWYGKNDRPFFDPEQARVPYDAVIAKKRAHLFNPAGKVSGDVLDIPRPPNHSHEWTGWPTQKPLALMRFLVRCHSQPGDLVGDFFCGSGTTPLAATMEGRRAFGCDIAAEAVALASSRLNSD